MQLFPHSFVPVIDKGEDIGKFHRLELSIAQTLVIHPSFFYSVWAGGDDETGCWIGFHQVFQPGRDVFSLECRDLVYAIDEHNGTSRFEHCMYPSLRHGICNGWSDKARECFGSR